MCDCIDMTNKALKEKGFKLAVGIRFAKNLSDATVFMPVALELIDDKPVGRGHRKPNVPIIYPSYCVFCGEKVEGK